MRLFITRSAGRGCSAGSPPPAPALHLPVRADDFGRKPTAGVGYCGGPRARPVLFEEASVIRTDGRKHARRRTIAVWGLAAAATAATIWVIAVVLGDAADPYGGPF